MTTFIQGAHACTSVKVALPDWKLLEARFDVVGPVSSSRTSTSFPIKLSVQTFMRCTRSQLVGFEKRPAKDGRARLVRPEAKKQGGKGVACAPEPLHKDRRQRSPPSKTFGILGYLRQTQTDRYPINAIVKSFFFVRSAVSHQSTSPPAHRFSSGRRGG